MTATDTELSCYTAALYCYLSGAFGGTSGTESGTACAASALARSVRLAVRPGPHWPAFSHHNRSMARLPDGTHLGYAAADTAVEAIAGIGAELALHQRVVVVANTAGIPWAPGYRGSGAAHWLLVDGHAAGRWHMRDQFAALLPAGEHRQQVTWLTNAELGAALAPVRAAPVQRLRDEHVFGFPVPVPAGCGPRWLVRRPGAGPVAHLPGTWLADADALGYLASWFCERGWAGWAVADDVWAAARHQSFRLSHLASTGLISSERAEEIKTVWRQLVQSLRFALQSARRGRPRASMIKSGFHAAATALRDTANAANPTPMERR